MTTLTSGLALPRGLSSSDRLYLSPADRTGDGAVDDAILRLFLRADGACAAYLVRRAELAEWAWHEGAEVAARVDVLLKGVGTAPRPVAGLSLDRARIMGIVNVTPDSFSDGGEHHGDGAGVAHGVRLLEEGAEILDIGGESTRPGAEPVPVGTELDRVLPAIEGLKGPCAKAGAILSIDTRKAEVMRRAIQAGAHVINDVTALTYEPDSLKVAADSDCPVILMHSQGDPRVMQEAPRYGHVLFDVFDYLEARLKACEEAGVGRERIILDPGIGFGKTLEHNLILLKGLGLFQALGCPVLLGVSRKSMIARLSRDEAPKERFPGSLAAGLWGVGQGARILRVHDVDQTRQALSVWQAIDGARLGGEPGRRTGG